MDLENEEKPIIAIDFDDTIIDDKGEFLPYAKEVLLELQKREYVLVLNTLRDIRFDHNKYSQYLVPAMDFLNAHGLIFLTPRDFPNSYKIPADIFIDDANFGGFPGWEKIADYFEIKLGEK